MLDEGICVEPISKSVAAFQLVDPSPSLWIDAKIDGGPQRFADAVV